MEEIASQSQSEQEEQVIDSDFLTHKRWNKSTITDLALMNWYSPTTMENAENELQARLVMGEVIVTFPVFEDGPSRGEFIDFEKLRSVRILEPVIQDPRYIANCCASPVWVKSAQGWFIIVKMIERGLVMVRYDEEGGYYALTASEALTRKRRAPSGGEMGNESTPGMLWGKNRWQ